METIEEVLESVKMLVESWCDERKLAALKFILNGYPLSSFLTDNWGELLKALENVRTFAKHELTEKEHQTVNSLINSIQHIIRR